MKQLPEKTNRPLTPKQRAYCIARASGFTQSASYLKAGYNPGTPEASNKNAFNLEQKPNVRAYLEKLRAESFSRDALSLQEKRSLIGRMVRAAPAEVDASSPLAQSYTEEVSPDGSVKRKVVLPDKARLIDLDIKMSGHSYADQKADAYQENPFNFLVAFWGNGSNSPLPKTIEAEIIEG